MAKNGHTQRSNAFHDSVSLHAPGTEVGDETVSYPNLPSRFQNAVKPSAMRLLTEPISHPVEAATPATANVAVNPSYRDNLASLVAEQRRSGFGCGSNLGIGVSG
jgi:hypothetical protein